MSFYAILYTFLWFSITPKTVDLPRLIKSLIVCGLIGIDPLIDITSKIITTQQGSNQRKPHLNSPHPTKHLPTLALALDYSIATNHLKAKMGGTGVVCGKDYVQVAWYPGAWLNKIEPLLLVQRIINNASIAGYAETVL